jgi:hypothetical protein
MILQYGEFNDLEKLQSSWSGYVTHVGEMRNAHTFLSEEHLCKLDPFEEEGEEWKIFI